MGLISRVSSRTYRDFYLSTKMAKAPNRDRFREPSYNIRQIHENSSDNLTIFNIVLPSDPAQKLHNLIKSMSSEQPVLNLSHDLSKELPLNAKITGSMVLGGQEFPISIKSEVAGGNRMPGGNTGQGRPGESGKIHSIYYTNSQKSKQDMYYCGDVGMKMDFEKCLDNAGGILNKIRNDVKNKKDQERSAVTLGKKTTINRDGGRSATPTGRNSTPMGRSGTPGSRPVNMSDKLAMKLTGTRMKMGSPVNTDIKDEQVKTILIHLLAERNYRKQGLSLFFKQNWKSLSEILFEKMVSNHDSVIKKMELVLPGLVTVIDRMDYKLKREFFKNVDPDWKGYAILGSKNRKDISEKVGARKDENVKKMIENGDDGIVDNSVGYMAGAKFSLRSEIEDANPVKEEPEDSDSEMEDSPVNTRKFESGKFENTKLKTENVPRAGLLPDPVKILEPPVKRTKPNQTGDLADFLKQPRPSSRTDNIQIQQNSTQIDQMNHNSRKRKSHAPSVIKPEPDQELISSPQVVPELPEVVEVAPVEIDPISLILNRLQDGEQADKLYKKLEQNLKTAAKKAEMKYQNHREIRENRIKYKQKYLDLVAEYRKIKTKFDRIKDHVKKIDRSGGGTDGDVKLAEYYETLLKTENFIDNHRKCSCLLAEVKTLTMILKN